ncbi:MAG: tetratricopeptide repeat protein, partial [Candidatus Cloacimonadaceae bacterium]|nr:tetratricopeptide repeat protein [Candidatus Cloacimonadaceae bacterium]
MIKITSTIVFFLLIISLWGQFDERSIMTQQATQLMARRQYAEAEQVFRQVLQKFPSDTNSVLQLLQICYLTSQIDKAEAILLEFNRTLPPQQYTEQMIQLYVMQGKPNLAWDLAQNYLSQNNHDQNRYRLIASYFERRGFYEQVLELYRNARIHNRNNDLFGLEYANTSLNYRLYRDAITEYLRFLDKNPANLYFVNNQIKTIIQVDSTMINVIGSFAMGAVNPVILELYATSLVNLKRFGEALEIYKSLSYEKLQGFATEQFTALNDDIAFAAYEHLICIGTNEVQKAETKYRLAQIRIRNADFASAHQILNDIINDQQLSDRNVRNRTTVNMNSRKMMAELILSTTAQIDSALVWYDAAKRFARNNLEATEIELEITKLLIMNEAYNAAAAKLKAINEPRLNETRDFYDLILALMQNEIARADSLMNEYVIK